MGATGTYGADFEDRGSRGDPADDVQRFVLPDYLRFGKDFPTRGPRSRQRRPHPPLASTFYLQRNQRGTAVDVLQ